MSATYPMMSEPTGASEPPLRMVTRTFGKYEIQVQLAPDGRFVGIVGISVKKDFRSQKQKIESRGFHDVMDLYESEDQ